MARPFWSGQLRISLVSFGIHLFPAIEARSEIRFHQLDRKTGERIKQRNISQDETPVEKDEIVKGYEYSKGEYVAIEPEEIENLRIPSRQTVDIAQFCDLSELGPKFFEKPYFATPENEAQSGAFAVVRKALRQTKKIGLGKIAFGGREHILAIAAAEDEKELGLMAYTVRYPQELRDANEYFADIKPVAVDDDQLSLAKELIERKTARFDPGKFTDEYEAALRAMIDAKLKHLPVPKAPSPGKPAKVIDLMDALRKSLQSGEANPSKRPIKKAAASGETDKSKRLTLVRPSKSNAPKTPAKKRRSA